MDLTSQKTYSDVLFQKLGKDWYAFTEINDDIIYSVLPDGVDPKSSSFELFEVIDSHIKKVSKIKYKRSPEIAV